MESLIFIVSLMIFTFGLVSALAERSIVTAPMVFVAIGIIIGPGGLGWIVFALDSEALATVAEIALAIILFRDASTIPLKSVEQLYGIPLRLLGLALPITVVAGFFVAMPLFPAMPWGAMMAMALMLAPTDAALGEVVTTSKKVPEATRNSIGVESGLNDGLALPLFMACLAVLTEPSNTAQGASFWMFFAIEQIVFGAVGGAIIGIVGGRCVDVAAQRHWMGSGFQQLAPMALALIAYGAAEKLGGNGFVAAFFAGLMLGIRSPSLRTSLQEFGEAEGKLLILFVFFIFGTILVPLAADYWSVRAIVYAVLSLTIIRMLPVAISLVGSGSPAATIGFIGWFGPRGIASILYLLLFINTVGTETHEEMLAAVVLTILLSIYLHGLSAVPLSGIYGRWMNKHAP